MAPHRISVIDSHVHLWPASEMESLRIYSPDGPFNVQRSVNDYKKATESWPNLLGFVFVEVDRKYDLEAGKSNASGWEAPLQEIRFVRRIILDQPNEGEGHVAGDGKLCLGMIPWAPLLSGVESMKRYLILAKEAAGDAWPKVKGFRYLLQDKPHGSMLEDDFIDSLKLLGREGFVFEIGADHSRRGDKQLAEVVSMVKKAHYGVLEHEKVTFIINHLCKPNLSLHDAISEPTFHSWTTAMNSLSSMPQVYIKLSGCFNQISESQLNEDPDCIAKSILPWLKVVLAAFGPSRILFGSDWPICNYLVDDEVINKWISVVDRMCHMCMLENESLEMIFAGAAKKAYRL